MIAGILVLIATFCLGVLVAWQASGSPWAATAVIPAALGGLAGGWMLGQASD